MQVYRFEKGKAVSKLSSRAQPELSNARERNDIPRSHALRGQRRPGRSRVRFAIHSAADDAARSPRHFPTEDRGNEWGELAGAGPRYHTGPPSDRPALGQGERADGEHAGGHLGDAVAVAHAARWSRSPRPAGAGSGRA